jgi:hypothetical protein
MAESLGIVIGRIDHDLSGERTRRDVSDRREGNRDDHYVTRECGFFCGSGASPIAEFGDEVGETFRAA